MGEPAAHLIDDEGADLTEEEWEAAWLPELERRAREIDEGRAVLIPAEEVIANLRKTYG